MKYAEHGLLRSTVESICIKMIQYKKNIFYTLYYLFREFGRPYPGKATAAARAALPSPTSHAESFRISVIHRTLTWTTGSLTCVRDHSYA